MTTNSDSSAGIPFSLGFYRNPDPAKAIEAFVSAVDSGLFEDAPGGLDTFIRIAATYPEARSRFREIEQKEQRGQKNKGVRSL